MLILVCGLQGTGKTTVARILGELMNATVLRTDVIRKELFKKPTYSDKEFDAIYDELFKRASRIRGGVILDATFSKEKHRNKAVSISKNAVILEVICKEEVIKERLKERQGDESNAKFEQYLLFKKTFEPIKTEKIVIDNSKTIEELKQDITEKIKNNLL